MITSYSVSVITVPALTVAVLTIAVGVITVFITDDSSFYNCGCYN